MADTHSQPENTLGFCELTRKPDFTLNVGSNRLNALKSGMSERYLSTPVTRLLQAL